MQIRPIKSWHEVEEKTCYLQISGPPEIGDIVMSLPEAIIGEKGVSSLYPVGEAWVRNENKLVQEVVNEEDLFGPSTKINSNTVEIARIQLPIDSTVTWRTTGEIEGKSLEFKMKLTNVGDKAIEKAAAAICIRFLQSDWWADEKVFVLSDHRVRSLSELGRDAGIPNNFQAYPLRGQSFDNVFYREFWGFNRNKLDKPIMVSEHSEAGLCVGVMADNAYFLHSNRGNPCTDLMLAFGNVSPGAAVETGGRIWIKSGKARDLLTQ